MVAKTPHQGQARSEDAPTHPPRAILALDTSIPAGVIALRGRDGQIGGLRTDPQARHGRTLLPAIRDLAVSLQVPLSHLDAIAVGLGPGSYTGLRVGLTAAKTLAYALGCPLLAIDTFELFARGVPAEFDHVCVVTDAQRGRVYLAEFKRQDPDSERQRIGPNRIEPLDDWLNNLHGAPLAIVGPAALRLREMHPDRFCHLDTAVDEPAWEPLLTLAIEASLRAPILDPWALEPLYLQTSAAEQKFQAHGGLPRRADNRPGPASPP